jgi:hypothetical protein
MIRDFVEVGPSFLSDRHKTGGISCKGCHKESPPKEQVPTPLCNTCHGNQKKIGEKTFNIIPNLHDSLLENLEFELCHHGRKPFEN